MAWHLVIWVPIAHIVWSHEGWFYDHRIRDFAGGIVVHMVGAFSIVAVGLVTNTTHTQTPVNKPDNALWYSIIVWFLWFGLNTGKAYSAASVMVTSTGAMAIACQVVVNTIAATTSSILAAYFYDMIFERPTTSTSLSMAIILGCVSITSACGFVTVGGAMCIALFTTLVTLFVAHNVLGQGVEANTPINIATIHGLGGSIGFLGTAIFEYEFINANAYNGLTYGHGMPLAYHISAFLAIASSVIVTVYVLAFIFNALCPLTNEVASYSATATTENKGEGKADEAGVVSAI
jgi:Amt family ammonium transporter